MKKLFEFDQHIGDWRVLVQSRDIKNGAIQSRHISPEAVTTEKIGDGEVKSRNIADGAVTTEKIGDGEVESRNIANGAVTTEKIGDGEVESRNIADGAVTTEKIGNGEVKSRHIEPEAVTTEKIAPKAVTTPKLAEECITGDELEDEVVKPGKISTDAVQTRNIKDQNVTKDKIKDGDLSWEKLDDDLQNIIASAGQHGVALSNEWGDSTLIGLTQKMLSETLGNVHKDGDNFVSLQYQIDQIVSGGATVNLVASQSVIFANTETDIALTASTNKDASSITITGGGLSDPITGSGSRAEGTDQDVNRPVGTISYLATFIISGLQRTFTRNVSVVYPIYYGAGLAQSDVLDVPGCKASARTSPTATYTVEITGNSKYIWFFVPANMSIQITSAKMNGFDFPLERLADVTDASNVTYKVYRTPQTNEVGTYVIDINKNN